MMYRALVAAVVLLAACARNQEPGDFIPMVSEPEYPHPRREAAMVAMRAGFMPLAAARIDSFATRNPAHDGRGVLIAILDSGIEPSLPGLQWTSDGRAKLLDLRDFSGEGEVTLYPVQVAGDSLILGPIRLAGAAGLARISEGQIWGGMVLELRFGGGPAADLNGNGIVGDSLMVVVAKVAGEWTAVVDSDGDGSLAGEPLIRDYAVAREWFMWQVPGGRPSMGVAVNLIGGPAGPELRLVMDNSGHGTHVAAVAAANDMYGLADMDGVAPGARLLGAKISSSADGGVTISAAIREALQWSIGYARARNLPLVVNISFGVGSERSTPARIDALIDSVLARYPEVLVTVAASNDGPGLGTLGFPGTAGRVISVGAVQSAVFGRAAGRNVTEDVVAFYSSRGGARMGPDIVAPGTAWAMVPPFKAGEEEQSGTSMAAPYVAGIAARLIGMELAERGVMPSRSRIFQALIGTADPLPGATALDQGAGVPDIVAAAQWLRSHARSPAEVLVEGVNDPLETALWDVPPGSTARFRLVARGARSGPLGVAADVPWLVPEEHLLESIGGRGRVVSVRVGEPDERGPGWNVGTLRIFAADDDGAVVARIPVTLMRRLPAEDSVSIPIGGERNEVVRHFFEVDSGRPFQLQVHGLGGRPVTVALHEPGGRPYRNGHLQSVSVGNMATAIFDVDASDALNGTWEIAVVPEPGASVSAELTLLRSPVMVTASESGGRLNIEVVNLTRRTLMTTARVSHVGTVWTRSVGGHSATVQLLGVPVPVWANELVLDVGMQAAAWPRFTDFGVTWRTRSGMLVGRASLNYGAGRMRIDVPESVRGDSLWLVLRPASADAPRSVSWGADVSVKFHPVPPMLPQGDGWVMTLAPGLTASRSLPSVRPPGSLGHGMTPLVTVVLDGRWTTEIELRGDP